jgi:hypothetical protein
MDARAGQLAALEAIAKNITLCEAAGIRPSIPPGWPPCRDRRRRHNHAFRRVSLLLGHARTGMPPGMPGGAMCVQRFDDSLNSAIHITYRISLRSSSMREPRDPLLKVFFIRLRSTSWLPAPWWVRRASDGRGGG